MSLLAEVPLLGCWAARAGWLAARAAQQPSFVKGHESASQTPRSQVTRKVLIFVLKQNAPNMPQNIDSLSNYWGLGDMLRGMVCCHQLAAKYGYDFVIDMRYHPVSQLVPHQAHGYEYFVDSCVSDLHFTLPNQLETLIKHGSRQPHIQCVLSNGLLHGPAVDHNAISLLSKTFMLVSLASSLNVPSHKIVVHLRFGDDSLVRSGQSTADAFASFLAKLAHFPRHAMILSDSIELKNELKQWAFTQVSLHRHILASQQDLMILKIFCETF